jgi:hypothetical protein
MGAAAAAKSRAASATGLAPAFDAAKKGVMHVSMFFERERRGLGAATAWLFAAFYGFEV